MDARQPDDPRLTPLIMRRDLVAAGWNDRAIARMVQSGTWVRIRRGAYVNAGVWQRLDEAGRYELRTRAVLLQAKTPVVASHTSSVPFHEGPTWGLDLSEVHHTRRDGRTGRAEAGVRQHRGRILPGDVVVRHGVQVMSATRTAIEVTTVADVEPALSVVCHLLHHRQTDLESLRARYAIGMERWSRTLSTDLVLRLASPLVESVGEARFLYFCFHHHLPAPRLQHPIRDRHGRVVARVDFAWPELGVFVEFDGRIKYEGGLLAGGSASDVVIREKQREDLIRELTGWRCLRVVWRDLEAPEQLAQRLQQVLFSGVAEVG